MTRRSHLALGIPLLALGLVLGTAGTVIAASVGPDDQVSTAPTEVRGTGVAVVADDVRVAAAGIAVPEGLGSLTLTVTARDGREMFAGVAAPADVRRYLAGSPYEVVVDLTSGGVVTTSPVAGNGRPAAPTTQTFWTTSSAGSPASLSARIPPGSSLVVMSSDAAAGVDATMVVTLKAPHAFVYSCAAAGVGAVLLLLGVVLLVRARSARRRESGPVPGVVPAVVAPATPPPAVPDAAVVPFAEGEPESATPAPVAADGVVVAALAAEPSDAGPEVVEVPSDLVPASEVAPVLAPGTDIGVAEVADPGAVGAETAAPGAERSVPAATATSEAAEWPAPVVPVDGARLEPADGAEPEPVDGAEPEPVVPGNGPAADADGDPLFAELVSAYGVDPVHDALGRPTDEPENGGVPEQPGASDPAPVGG
ncbi:MAG TPA: hypothetical protein VLV82_06395 [Candidatus Angelobacter sp.]|nr:hypothetical protein [Candidatus Angelobacter sp.]